MNHHALPGWIYDDPELHALEREHIFLRTWQLVAHVSELREPGDWVRLDLAGESFFVLRGDDGTLRAFYNVCRHRASRLVDGDAGRCSRRVRCPYHGWSYGFDGRLDVVPGEDEFAGLDRQAVRLPEVALEECLGFVFLRALDDDGPGVAEQLAPYRAELAGYRIEEMVPLAPHAGQDTGVDWKTAIDNNIEAYHVPVAHPGLQRLFGHDYAFDVQAKGVSRGGGAVRERNSANWSERVYLRLLPDMDHLPTTRRRAWHYYSLFPNLAFDIYPDMIDYFQILPTAAGRSRIRARAFGLPAAAFDSLTARRLRAARWANDRINRLVGEEDVGLVRGVQAGLASRSYGSGVLGRREARVAQFHDLVRERLPVAGLADRPAPGTVAAENARLLAGARR